MAEQNHTPMMGNIIFGEPASGRTRQEVLQAAQFAGLPADLVRELHPRHAFTRGMAQLAKDGMIACDLRDKNAESAETVEFSFIQRLPGSEYSSVAVVQYNKKSQQIFVVKGDAPSEIIARANALIAEARHYWTCADINALVYKYLSGYTKRIPLRAGVYFVPHTAQNAATAVQTFYRLLGFRFMVVPVGYTQENAESIHAAIVQDIKNEIAAVVAEITELTSVPGKQLTKRIGARNLSELRKKLLHYRNLAISTQTEMSTLIEAAGENATLLSCAENSTDALLRLARAGRDVSPFLVDLVEATADEGDSVVAELRRVVETRATAPVIQMDAKEIEEMPLLAVMAGCREFVAEKGAE